MPRMHKYGEPKMTRIMMTTVRHVTSSLGLSKFQAASFLLNRGYKKNSLPKYIRIQHIFIKNKYNNYTLYTVSDMRYGGLQLDEITLDHILSKMFVYTSQKI
jgi:hypothetical protein